MYECTYTIFYLIKYFRLFALLKYFSLYLSYSFGRLGWVGVQVILSTCPYKTVYAVLTSFPFNSTGQIGVKEHFWDESNTCPMP